MKKRKIDEAYKWAELCGKEAEIREHLEEQNKVKPPFFYSKPGLIAQKTLDIRNRTDGKGNKGME